MHCSGLFLLWAKTWVLQICVGGEEEAAGEEGNAAAAAASRRSGSKGSSSFLWNHDATVMLS